MNFEEITQLKADLDAYRPLPTDVMRKLSEKLRLDWNYHSNALEGNTLTYGETKALLLHDRYIGNKEGRHYRDMRAHNDVIKNLDELVKEDKYPLTQSLIRDLHEQMLGEPYFSEALTSSGQRTQKLVNPGQYKTQPNSVLRSNGEMFYYADPIEVSARMSDLLARYEGLINDPTVHPLYIAVWFHYVFIRIHPFDDGNGRMARILMNLILMRRGYSPAIIPTQAKSEYLEVLQSVDANELVMPLEEALDPFLDLVGRYVSRTLELELKAAKGEDLTEPEDWKKELFIIKEQIEAGPKIVYKDELSVEELINIINKAIDNLKIIFDAISPLYKHSDFTLSYWDGTHWRPSLHATTISHLSLAAYNKHSLSKYKDLKLELTFGRVLSRVSEDCPLSADIRISLATSRVEFKSDKKSLTRLYREELSNEFFQPLISLLGQRLAKSIKEFMAKTRSE